MTNFIKLTSLDSSNKDRSIYINPENIIYMCDYDENDCTLLYLKERGQFCVAETKEDILEKIKNIKYKK